MRCWSVSTRKLDCEKVILAVLKAQTDYLDDLWGDEEENGEEDKA